MLRSAWSALLARSTSFRPARRSLTVLNSSRSRAISFADQVSPSEKIQILLYRIGHVGHRRIGFGETDDSGYSLLAILPWKQQKRLGSLGDGIPEKSGETAPDRCRTAQCIGQ